MKVHVEVYGCSANQADAEIAGGLLVEAGHTLVDRVEEADVSVLLTCVVKTPTERKMVRRLKGLVGRKIVVAGCMPKALKGVVGDVSPEASLVGPDNIVQIPLAVEEAAVGRRVVYLDGVSANRTCLPRVRRSGIVHIAPIASGCLGNCSYCIVKVARGRLHSFPPEEIVVDAKAAVDFGCKEIWVTAEDTAAYEYNGVKLPELLGMLGTIKGKFLVRVGMMTPNSALPIIDELVEALRGEKMFQFVHAPVQAGADEVLVKMRRRYSTEEFRELVTRLRWGIPDIGISTDIICGFPGESDAQFEESLKLVEWLRPDALNMSRFWPRLGTEAAGFGGQLNGRVTKDRSRRLDALWTRVGLEANKAWLGWEGDVLLDELGHSGAKMGRTRSYKAVTVMSEASLGEWIKVRVTGAERAYLKGVDVSGDN